MIKHSHNVPPFLRFCTAHIPSIFDDSMSYYEVLCALTKFIQENVEVTNENADILQELYTYTHTYLDNLDVQDEINKKLDAMVQDGTIKSILNNKLLGEINNKVVQNTLDISSNKDEINNKVGKNESDSITLDMLTQEVLETMTGGSVAVVGEDSVGIENIKDKAVNIFKLDDELQQSKYIVFGDYIDLGSKSNGICRENTGTHKIEIASPTSTDYGWYKVALEKGKSYAFTGYYYGPIGFIIADSQDNVVSNPNPNPSTYGQPKPYSNIFTAEKDGLYLYIGTKSSLDYGVTNSHFFTQVNCPSLRVINKIINKVEVVTPKLLKTVAGHLAHFEHIADMPATPQLWVNASTDLKLYQMTKGVKYHVKGSAWYSAVGIYILNNDNTIIYQSNNTNVGGTFTEYDYTFTASQDGYIVVHEYDRAGHSPLVEVISDIPSTSSESLSFSKWYALGDSITEVNFRASTNYVNYIKDELGIEVVNLAHSGAGYYRTTDGGHNFRTEVNEITGYNYNTDVMTILGSINDYSQVGAHLGQLGDTGTDTIYGCMYTFFNNLQNRFMGVRLGVITMPPCYDNRDSFMPNARLYNKALKETAELFDVPVLDITESCNLKPWEASFRTEFYSSDGTGASGQVDNVHPNSKGHWLIHNKIKEFLKTL